MASSNNRIYVKGKEALFLPQHTENTAYVSATADPGPSSSTANAAPNASSTRATNRHLIFVMPTSMPPQRNVSTSCRVMQSTKATSCVPKMNDQQTQTDEQKEQVAIVPVPVPVYVPSPLHMFTMPTPVPVPFPLPIPVPFFIPLTRNAADDILQDINEFQGGNVRDPLEAELVKMAEILAETTQESKKSEEFKKLDKATRDSDYKVEDVIEENKHEADEIVDIKKPKVERSILVQTRYDTDGSNTNLKYMFGVSAWKKWVKKRNLQLQDKFSKETQFNEDILKLSTNELSFAMFLFIEEVRKPDQTEYAPDTIFYFCLGIQKYLIENNRYDNIFCDAPYKTFNESFNKLTRKFLSVYENCNFIITRIEEEHLWEAQQLGVHSPQVLLNTIIYFNTKFFRLKTVDEHLKLSFSHVVKHWGKNRNGKKKDTLPCVSLRFYPPGLKKNTVYELRENAGNPFRCPLKLHEFYLSKCPQSVKNRDDVYYVAPEKSCLSDSPVWFSTIGLERDVLEEILNRYRMVKEIAIACMTD